MSVEERLEETFGFPLFKALSQRRVRRFGLGYELDDGTFKFKSSKEPLRLTDLETALLAWAGDGINGLALGEAQVATGVHATWNGRVHPSACNFQDTLLMIVNDDGVFAYKPPDATQVVEIKEAEDRRKILDIYSNDTVQLKDIRPDFSSSACWIPANLWLANKPGSTLFFPLVDVTAEYINILLGEFDRTKIRVMDQQAGQWAGICKWIEEGELNGPQVTLLFMELSVLNACVASAHYKAQNIALACEALGLGNFTFSGFAPMVILGGTPFSEGLGLRFVSGRDGMPNPVGLDGHLEGHCPPYFDTMDQVVDKVVAARYGPEGILTPDYEGLTPIKDWKSLVERAPRISEMTIQATKDFCNYLYDTYGRFPAMIDSIQAPIASQVHHLDLEFYDHYYPPDVISDTIRNHHRDWH